MHDFTHVKFALNALVSELLAKIYILPLCSIFSHGGHLGWLVGSRHTFFKLDTPMMSVAKFSLIWPSSFREEDFCKRLLRLTKKWLKIDYKGQ